MRKAGFPSGGSTTLPKEPVQGEDHLSGEIFDQASLRSQKARKFAEAFAGCGEWIEPPPRRRRTSTDGPFDGLATESSETSYRLNDPGYRDRYRPAA